MKRITCNNVHNLKQTSSLGKGPLRNLFWIPDSDQLIVTSTRGVWKYQVGKSIREVMSYANPPAFTEYVSVSEDVQLLCIGTFKPSYITILNVADGSLISRIDIDKGNLISAQISPDGGMLAYRVEDNQSETLIIWDLTKGHAINLPADLQGQGKHQNLPLAFSPGGGYFCFPAKNRTLLLIDLMDISHSKKLRFPVNKYEEIRDIAFHPSGKYLATSAPGHGTFIWNIDRTSEDYGTIVFQLEKPKISQIQFDHSGTRMALATFGYRGSGFDIHLFDIPSWQELFTIPDGIGYDQGMHFSPQGDSLACTTQKTEVHVWDLSKKFKISTLKGHQWGGVRSVQFSSDGELLASASLSDQSVRIWDMETRQQHAIIRGFSTSSSSLSFALSTPYLAVKETNDIARVWDLEQKQIILDSWGRGDGRMMAVTLSQDGRYLAERRSTTVTVREISPGTIHTKIKKQKKPGGSHFIEFSPNVEYLAFDGKNKSIVVWKMVDQEQLELLDHKHYGLPNTLTFSHDSKKLAVAAGQSVVVWDLDQNTIIAKYQLDEWSTKMFLKFGPTDQNILVADGGGRNPTVIWDWKEDTLKTSIPGTPGTCQASPDLSFLVIAKPVDKLIQFVDSHDGTVLHEFEKDSLLPVRTIEISADQTRFALIHDSIIDIYETG